MAKVRINFYKGIKTMQKYTIERLQNDWQAMLDRGTIPLFEIGVNHADEYLIVDIEFDSNGLIFTLGIDGDARYFSGNVKQHDGGGFIYEFDEPEFLQSLDYYLQEVYQEIVEGFILPNGLYLMDE